MMSIFQDLFGSPKKKPITSKPCEGKYNILLYNDFFGENWWIQERDIYPSCHFFKDRRFIRNANAVVFHLPAQQSLQGISKTPGQRWVGFSAESDVNYPHQADPELLRRLDWTATYHLDSDIPTTYLDKVSLEALTSPIPIKSRTALASCFISNCHSHSKREDYLTELARHIPIDFYGKLLKNCNLAEDQGYSTKLNIIGSYKFNLAFENSISRDYVTEKIFHPLMRGTVPVYLGAPNIQQFVPAESCFIPVDQFPDPAELAAYLKKLDGDDDAYFQYFKWKKQPLQPSFLELYHNSREPAFRVLGKKLLAACR